MARPKYDPNEPVTRKMLDEVVEAILVGTEGLISGLRQETVSGFQAVDKRFKGIDHRLNELEVGQRHIKDQLRGLKSDLSVTPTRRQFEQLKSKVDRHHPGPG